MISYGINTFLWASPFTTQHLPLLDKAKGLGFDLWRSPSRARPISTTRRLPRRTSAPGLTCSLCGVMGAGRDPGHEDEAIQKGGVAYLKHLIDAAVTMKAVAVVGPHYAAVGRTWQATPEQRKRDLERCTKNLKQVARYAEDKGITLAMEPLNRFETSFINLTEQALELVRMIDSPRDQAHDGHLPREHRGEEPGQGHRGGRLPHGARARQRERPRDARHRARGLDRDRAPP